MNVAEFLSCLMDLSGVLAVTCLVSYLFFDGFLNIQFKNLLSKALFHGNNAAMMAFLLTLTAIAPFQLSLPSFFSLAVYYLVLLAILPVFVGILVVMALEHLPLLLWYDRCVQESRRLNWGIKLEMLVILSATLCLSVGLSQVELFRGWFGYYSEGQMWMTYVGLLGVAVFVVQVFFNRAMAAVRASLAVLFFYPVLTVLA